MAQKVKFLVTSVGDYGVAHTDDELVVTDSVAKSLEKAGTVKVLSSAGEDKVTTVDKGSVRFHDETAKTTATAGETDPKNPTGPDKPAPKATPLKSAAKKSAKK